MSNDYYYNYDPNMNLTFTDDIYYGNFPTEVDLYNKVVTVDNERQGKQVKKVRFADEVKNGPIKRNQVKKSQQQMQMAKKNKQGEGSLFNTSILCLLILLVIFFTMWRYGLIGMALDKGETLPALALLTPEIGNAIYLAAL